MAITQYRYPTQLSTAMRIRSIHGPCQALVAGVKEYPTFNHKTHNFWKYLRYSVCIWLNYTNSQLWKKNSCSNSYPNPNCHFRWCGGGVVTIYTDTCATNLCVYVNKLREAEKERVVIESMNLGIRIYPDRPISHPFWGCYRWPIPISPNHINLRIANIFSMVSWLSNSTIYHNLLQLHSDTNHEKSHLVHGWTS